MGVRAPDGDFEDACGGGGVGLAEGGERAFKQVNIRRTGVEGFFDVGGEGGDVAARKGVESREAVITGDILHERRPAKRGDIGESEERLDLKGEGFTEIVAGFRGSAGAREPAGKGGHVGVAKAGGAGVEPFVGRGRRLRIGGWHLRKRRGRLFWKGRGGGRYQ